MATRRNVHVRSIAVLALSYLVGLVAYPYLPGPFLEQTPSARIEVAFTLPTAALVIFTLFRSLWTHDRVRTGNGAFESTYQAIGFGPCCSLRLHVVVAILLTDAMDTVLVRSWGRRSTIVMLGLTSAMGPHPRARTSPSAYRRLDADQRTTLAAGAPRQRLRHGQPRRHHGDRGPRSEADVRRERRLPLRRARDHDRLRLVPRYARACQHAVDGQNPLGGPLTILSAIGAVLVVRVAAVAILGPPSTFLPLNWFYPIVDTTVLVTAAVIVFVVVAFAAANPIRLYRRIALAALFVSFIPDLRPGRWRATWPSPWR
jgi:hypothetical protein